MIYVCFGPEDMLREPTHVTQTEKVPYFSISNPEIRRGYHRGKTAHVGSFHLNTNGIKKLFGAVSVTTVDGLYQDQLPQLVIKFTWPNKEGRLCQRFVVGAEILNTGMSVDEDEIENLEAQYIALDQNRKWEYV